MLYMHIYLVEQQIISLHNLSTDYYVVVKAKAITTQLDIHNVI